MRRRTRIAVACALAAAFIAAGPAPAHATSARDARIIHSLQARNDRQARMIRYQWRKIDRLRHELREARTRDSMLVALELMPVTFAELESFRAQGMTGGRIYLGE